MAKELLGIAKDEDISPETRLKAIVHALDRSLGRATTNVDVSVGPKPYEAVLGAVTLSGGSRTESRAARGLVDDSPRMLPPAPRPDVPLDVEIVSDDGAMGAVRGGDELNDAGRENGPDAPGTGLMPMEDALELLAKQQTTGKRP